MQDVFHPACGAMPNNEEGIAMAEQGYCVKCKAKRDMNEAKEVAMNAKGGGKRRAMKGKCSKCGTTMFKIMHKK